MIWMNSTAEIMDAGMNCLLEKLGVIETERFIATIIREKSDYTKWRRKYFEDISSEEFNREAEAYGKEHPFIKKQ